jgi:RNA polymerase sigma-70 factor, ECF subfamily
MGAVASNLAWTGTATVDDLIRRARDGDVEAFEGVYRSHSGRVFALILRLTGDRGRAEELTQETFFKVWRHLARYRLGTRFEAWLRTIAINTVYGDSRSRARRHAREVGPMDAETWDPPDRHVEPRIGMDLEQAIAALPEGARKVFVLHEVEGLRHEEIGQHLGVASGTSKAQLHRARKLLREALSS